MDWPENLFIRPVKDHDDLVAFSYPFKLSGKALEDGPTVEENAEGDLIIEGWAADFDGLDRQGENFLPGAFQRGIKAFLSGTASLNYHHKHDHVLGKVLALEEKAVGDRHGLWMRARVDHQPQTSPLRYLYDQIKKGTLSGLSVQGFFKRVLTPNGPRIAETDMTEISVTNVPVHTRPAFAVVAGKALESLESPEDGDVPNKAVEDVDWASVEAALNGLDEALQRTAESKAVSGDPKDLYFIANLIDLQQRIGNIVDVGPDDPGDERVVALAKRVQNYFDGVAREAHSLAAELGPLPRVYYG